MATGRQVAEAIVNMVLQNVRLNGKGPVKSLSFPLVLDKKSGHFTSHIQQMVDEAEKALLDLDDK